MEDRTTDSLSDALQIKLNAIHHQRIFQIKNWHRLKWCHSYPLLNIALCVAIATSHRALIKTIYISAFPERFGQIFGCTDKTVKPNVVTQVLNLLSNLIKTLLQHILYIHHHNNNDQETAWYGWALIDMLSGSWTIYSMKGQTFFEVVIFVSEGNATILDQWVG